MNIARRRQGGCLQGGCSWSHCKDYCTFSVINKTRVHSSYPESKKSYEPDNCAIMSKNMKVIMHIEHIIVGTNVFILIPYFFLYHSAMIQA